MAALFKYVMGIAVILLAVMLISALIISEIFASFAAVAQTPVTERPRWNIERLKAEPDTANIALGSLSPIYPATPGKELLGRPVDTASTKRINIRQALQLHKFLRRTYSVGEEDRNYPQQSLSYTEAPRSQPLQSRMPIIFGRGIY